EPSSQREPEPSPLPVSGPRCTPADTGLEDAIGLVERETRPVVLDGVDDTRGLAPDLDPDAGCAVSTGVLEHGLQDPLGKVAVDPDAKPLLRPVHLKRHLPLGCAP